MPESMPKVARLRVTGGNRGSLVFNHLRLEVMPGSDLGWT
jgi:hypothetical protein